MSSLINFAAEPHFLDQMLTNHVISRIMDGLLVRFHNYIHYLHLTFRI